MIRIFSIGIIISVLQAYLKQLEYYVIQELSLTAIQLQILFPDILLLCYCLHSLI